MMTVGEDDSWEERQNVRMIVGKRVRRRFVLQSQNVEESGEGRSRAR
jgi:hypothetical protein